MEREIRMYGTSMPSQEQIIFHELGRMIDENLNRRALFKKNFKYNVNQKKLFDVLNSCPVPKDMFVHVLCYGGVRSGKTYGILAYAIDCMLSFPGVRALAVRTHLKEVRTSIYADAKNLLDQYNVPYKKNDTNLVITLENGSELWCTSDKSLVPTTSDKADALGGTQFSLALVEECIYRENLVHTLEGERRICDITPGTMVYGWDGSRFNLYPVLAVECKGYRPMWAIHLQSGRVLEATENHPILTRAGWKYVCDLRPGEEYCSMRGLRKDTKEFQDRELQATVSRMPQSLHQKSPPMPRMQNQPKSRDGGYLPGVLQQSPPSSHAILCRLPYRGETGSYQVQTVLLEEHGWGGVSEEESSRVCQEAEREGHLSGVGLRERDSGYTGILEVGVHPSAPNGEIRCGLLPPRAETGDRSYREFLYGAPASRNIVQESSLLEEAGGEDSAPTYGIEAQESVDGKYSWGDRIVAITPAGIGEVWDLKVDGVHNFVAEGIVVHNCDSISEELVNTLPGRMSQQVGDFRKAILYACNPPSKNSWVYRWFFEEADPNDPDSRYRAVEMPMEGNVEWLGQGYIQSVTEDYARNPQFYKRMRRGQFGSNIKGHPYFNRDFQENVHVSDKPLVWNRMCPMVRGWDFGASTGLVVLQDDIKTRQIKVFRAILGQNTLLESFYDQYIPELERAFPGAHWIDYCDPAGRQKRTETPFSSIDILRSKGLRPKFNITSIAYGLNVISEQLRLFINSRPCLIIDSECEILIEGFLGGYAQKKDVHSEEMMPVKDGYYDHVMDAFRYAMIFLRKPGQSKNPNALGERHEWVMQGTEGPTVLQERTSKAMYAPSQRTTTPFRSRMQ